MKSDIEKFTYRVPGGLTIATILLTLAALLAIWSAIAVKSSAPIPTVANSATVDASSQTTTVIDDEVVYGGMAVLDDQFADSSNMVDQCVPVPCNRFGAVENGIYYPFACLPAVDPASIIETRITHYGPPTFGLDNCHTATGYTPREALAICEAYSLEWGVPIDGFCAVSRNLPWYTFTEPPTLIYVDGHGNYLVLDHKGAGDCAGVDLYLPNQDGCEFSEECLAWEVSE